MGKKKSVPRLRNNPTLLTLLKYGCKVCFPSGYILEGDPEDSYIQERSILSGNMLDEGLRNLDREGVELSLEDEREFRRYLETEC